MKKTTLVAIALGLGFAVVPAHAAERGIDRSIGSVRQEMMAMEAKNLIKIEGTLSCDTGAQNNGQACVLKIRDGKTGRLYRLADANAAMSLYQSGRKNVAIEARANENEADLLEVIRTIP